jgi:carboxypeptidase family protein
VTGVVRSDSGEAIAGARVSVKEWNTAVLTGSDGKYILQGPAGQNVTIQVDAFGYLSQTDAAVASAGTVTTKQFALVWARRPMNRDGR